jgi:hypothetical protein
MQWVVTHSDILIAVWNGLPGNGIGGTADAVEHALRLNQDWIHINTSNQQTVFYLSKIKLH